MAAEYPTAADVAASVPHFDDCLEYVRARLRRQARR